MPKMKTHKATAKRVRKTATGKVRHVRSNGRHYLEHKPSKRKRRLGRPAFAAKGDARRVRKLLGG